MKRRLKRLICIMSIVAVALSTNVTAFAGGQPFHFTVAKNNGNKEQTGVVSKNDSERRSYITVKTVMWSWDDPWVFGARVRSEGGTALTGYVTTNRIGAMGEPGLPFLSGVQAYAGQRCIMRGQVDSSSRANTITATGVWLP